MVKISFYTALSLLLSLGNLHRFDGFTLHVSYLIFYDTSLYVHSYVRTYIYLCVHATHCVERSHIQDECWGTSSEYDDGDVFVDDDYDLCLQTWLSTFPFVYIHIPERNKQYTKYYWYTKICENISVFYGCVSEHLFILIPIHIPYKKSKNHFSYIISWHKAKQRLLLLCRLPYNTHNLISSFVVSLIPLHPFVSFAPVYRINRPVRISVSSSSQYILSFFCFNA